MASLRFFYGTMGSGKSTQALQINHNLRSRGLRTVLITQHDRSVGRVSSRIGASQEAIIIEANTDLFQLAADQAGAHNKPDKQGKQNKQDRGAGGGGSSPGPLHALICDEAQFYDPRQIEQLARVVDDLEIDVYAFGLLTSFQGELFPGSSRLLELADERNELQVEMRCFCGRRATHNARLINGVQVYDGALKVIGDTGGDAVVTYDLRCRRHWHEGLRAIEGEQLELPIDTGDCPGANPDSETDANEQRAAVDFDLTDVDSNH